MKALKLWGGLGNQMFLYAFGRHLEETRNEKVLFYCVPFDKEFATPLNKLNTKTEFLGKNEFDNIHILPATGLFYRIERKAVQKLPFINSSLFVESNALNHSKLPGKASYFDGYFQSYHFAGQISALLQNEFTLNTNTLTAIKDAATVPYSPDSVAIHFRRGDYLYKANARIFAPCSDEYYTKAIKIIRKKIEKPVFFIFSNDIALAKQYQELFEGHETHFVDNSDIQENYIADFYMMSNCSHNIIANSTFSWWAAWLNKNPDKIVIAPKNWYNKEKMNQQTVDLIPPEWIRV